MGLEAHAQPAARIVRSGKLPLVVALVEPKRPRRRDAVTAVETIPSLEDQVAAIEAAENDRLFTRPRAMIDAVLDAIRRTRDAAIKPGCCDARRSRVEAVENWDARAASGSLVMAAATPKGAVVLTTDDWSEIDANAFGAAQFEGGGAAPTAIETTEGRHRPRRQAQLRNAARIIGDGKLSWVVALAAHDDSTPMTLITTVELPPLAAAIVL